jgi:putative ABC transport system ATP-binding protein
MVVEVSDLAKRVDNGGEPLTILHEISFAVAAGETVAIVGASGSGKSTLLGLLAGLDLPSSGSVALAGEEPRPLDEDARAVLRGRLLGFVFQTFQLLPSLTRSKTSCCRWSWPAVPMPAARPNPGCSGSGWGTACSHYPKHLSGGEQQRVALARAFAPGPRLVLADEPTGNLDAATGHQVNRVDVRDQRRTWHDADSRHP